MLTFAYTIAHPIVGEGCIWDIKSNRKW